MAEDRPEKMAIRNLWLDEVKAIAKEKPSCEEPWYLTLPGAEGHDIELLIRDGLISLTEVESIAEEDQWKIVAVESSNKAVVALQRKFVGLRIKEVHFGNLVRSEGIFSWPQGEDERCCRALVVNLDLNGPLRAYGDNKQIVFPVLAWIDKLCHIHEKPPQLNWTLFLTLHGEIAWNGAANLYTKRFLCENLNREPSFATECEAFFGPELYEKAIGQDEFDFCDLDRTDQEKILMVMVPKIIAGRVHNRGWRVRTVRNLRYGDAHHAGMVTWIVKFTWDEDAISAPDATYREALRNILSSAGAVANDGKLLKLR